MMRFTSGISEFLHIYSGLSVAHFWVLSLNFVTVRWYRISVEADLSDFCGLLVLGLIFPVRGLGLQRTRWFEIFWDRCAVQKALSCLLRRSSARLMLLLRYFSLPIFLFSYHYSISIVSVRPTGDFIFVFIPRFSFSFKIQAGHGPKKIVYL